MILSYTNTTLIPVRGLKIKNMKNLKCKANRLDNGQPVEGFYYKLSTQDFGVIMVDPEGNGDWEHINVDPESARFSELPNLLHDFFNSRSDANAYLTASEQEEMENDFDKWLFMINL